MKAVVQASVLLLVIVVLVVAGVGFSIARRGLGTRTPPTAVERYAAWMMREWATPDEVRAAVNPVPRTDAVLTEAL